MRAIHALCRSLFWASLPLFYQFSLPIKSKELVVSAFEIWLLFSLFTFSLVRLRPLADIWIDRIGPEGVFVAALSLYSLACHGYAWSAGLTSMSVAWCLQGIGVSLLLIPVDTITTDLTPVAETGKVLGRNVETSKLRLELPCRVQL